MCGYAAADTTQVVIVVEGVSWVGLDWVVGALEVSQLVLASSWWVAHLASCVAAVAQDRCLWVAPHLGEARIQSRLD